MRAQEDRCPFCGAARPESEAGRSACAAAVLVSLAIAGCGQRTPSALSSSAPRVADADAHPSSPSRDDAPRERAREASTTEDDASSAAVELARDAGAAVPASRVARRREPISGASLRDGGLALLSLMEQPSTAPMYGAPPIDQGDSSASQSPDRPRALVVLRDLQLAAPSTAELDLRALALRFRSVQGALVQCASAALRADPALSGAVTVQLVVEGERVVGETRVQSAPTVELGQCFARVLRGARIAPPAARASLVGRWTVHPQR